MYDYCFLSASRVSVQQYFFTRFFMYSGFLERGKFKSLKNKLIVLDEFLKGLLMDQLIIGKDNDKRAKNFT